MRGKNSDHLDRYYTPDALAEACVHRVGELIPEPTSIIEPSVGGGAFARALRSRWPRAHLVGVDVDPHAAGLEGLNEVHVGDWPTIGPTIPPVDLCIGNPPFTGATALNHVRTARNAARYCAMILPWQYLGGVRRWRGMMCEDRPRYVMAIAPRPWSVVREVGLFVWGEFIDEQTTVLDPIEWERE